jgi:gamma-glutamyltranspeptidase/glutathione hydrolase
MLMLALLVANAAVSPVGAVAAAHPLAAEAGASILRRGGNAVDAAVAAAFALAVVEPQSSGLGGGGFALVYTARDRQVRVLDFREVGPQAARPDMYILDGQPRQDLANAGPLSVAVPAAVKGYAELAKRFGKKPLSQLVSPAEQIASRGFQVNLPFVSASAHRLDCLAADPEAARIFLQKGEDGEYESKQPGDKLIQPDLARTLHAIGLRGPDAFYKGRIARAMVESVASRGGILTLLDLARVQVRERRPIETTYRGNRVVTMPLPSSGGFIVAALLNVLEQEQPRAGGYRPERFLHAMIEAEKRLYALRQRIGDPDFNPGTEDRVRRIATKEYAADLRRAIGERATPSEAVVQEEHGTTHVAAVDEEGNAVALNTTVNDSFGSCIVAKGAGFVLNDEMDDFAVAAGVPNVYGVRGDVENAPGPGKVPLSSMAPTFVFAPDGALLLAIGTSGGASIPTTVTQAIVHLIDDGMAVDRAIAQPRLHHNLFPDLVRVEPNGLEAATVRALEQRGHRFQFGGEPLHEHGPGFFDTLWGKACGVQIDPDTGWRIGACDLRYDGGGAIP